MVALALPTADIGLYVDFEASRIDLPAPDVVTPSTSPDKAFVLFDGDSRTTGYRGTAASVEWAVTIQFGPSEQATAVALIRLLEAASYLEADGRLMLRTTGASVAGFDTFAVVEVTGWTPPRIDAGAIEVSLSATEVQYDVSETTEPGGS